jgi:hypothetical protein
MNEMKREIFTALVHFFKKMEKKIPKKESS